MACPWALGSGRYNHEPHEVNHLPDPREEETQAGRGQVRVAWVGGRVLVIRQPWWVCHLEFPETASL